MGLMAKASRKNPQATRSWEEGSESGWWTMKGGMRKEKANEMARRKARVCIGLGGVGRGWVVG